MGSESWQAEFLELYVDYLFKYGSVDNRYAFYGRLVNGPIMHILDILCCALRRSMRTTNLTGNDLFVQQSIGLPLHELICKDENWMIDPTLLLERLFVGRYQVGQSDVIRAVFSKMNFHSFKPEQKENAVSADSPFTDHHYTIIWFVWQKIKPSPQNQQVVEQLRDWASLNIFMTKVVRDELGLPHAPPRQARGGDQNGK